MKWCLVFMLVALSACVPSEQSFFGPSRPNFVSTFAGFFPEDPQANDLPVWKGSLESLEPLAVETVRTFDAQFQNVFTSDLSSAVRNGLKIHEIQGAVVTSNHLQIVLSETQDHVALGVFDLEHPLPERTPPGSLADKLGQFVRKALDAKFSRDRF